MVLGLVFSVGTMPSSMILGGTTSMLSPINSEATSESSLTICMAIWGLGCSTEISRIRVSAGLEMVIIFSSSS